jgi:hypothetical protein
LAHPFASMQRSYIRRLIAASSRDALAALALFAAT